MHKAFGQRLPQVVRTAAGLTAVAGLAIVTTLSMTGGGAAARTASRINSKTAAAANHLGYSRLLRERFKILRLPHSAAVSLPAGFDSFVDRAEPKYGLDLGATVSTQPSPGLTLWFVPGQSGACLLLESVNSADNGGTCGPTSANDLGFAFVEGTTSTRTVYGLAPDGNSHLAVQLANGATEKVAVTGNGYEVSEPRNEAIDSVSGIGLNGGPAEFSVGSAPALPSTRAS